MARRDSAIRITKRGRRAIAGVLKPSAIVVHKAP
jgi:hypothetical protein